MYRLNLYSRSSIRCINTSYIQSRKLKSGPNFCLTPIISFAHFNVMHQTNDILQLVDCSLYAGSQNDILAEIRELNRSNFTIANPKIAIQLIYQLGKRKIDLSPYESFLIAIRQSMPLYNKPFYTDSFSHLYFGMHALPPKSSLILEILGEIAYLLSKQSDLIVTSQSLGRCCSGLQHITGHHFEERRVIKVLADIIRRSPLIDLQPFSISSALYGMQSLNLAIAEVQDLFDAFSEHLLSSTPKVLLEWELGGALYGMRNIRADRPGERKFLEAFLPHMEATVLHNLKSSSTSVISMLYGTRNFDCNRSIEAKQVIGLVAKLVSQHQQETLSISQFSQLVFGLQHNTGRSVEELSLIQAISQLSVDLPADGTINVQHYSSLIYGLKSMSCTSPEERGLIKKIVLVLSSCGSKVLMNEQSLCNILFGIRFLKNSQYEVLQLVSLLASHIKKQTHLRLTGLQVGVCSYALSEYTGNSRQERNLFAAVADHINTAPRPALPHISSKQQLPPPVLSHPVTPSHPAAATQPVAQTQPFAPSQPLNQHPYRASLPAQAIANAYYGLRNLTGYHEEERYFMSAISSYYQHYNCAPLTTQAIAGSCFSFSTVNMKCKEAQELLRVISWNIRHTSAKSLPLTGANLGSICFGLSRISGHTNDEKLFIDALSEHIESAAQHADKIYLSSLNISSILNGIRKLSPVYHETRRLYRAILVLMQPYQLVPFDSKTLGAACSGLAHMAAVSTDESAFIQYIINIFENNPRIRLSGAAAGQAISGLRSMTGEHELERKLIRLIAQRLKPWSPLTPAIHISRQLYNIYLDYAFIGIKLLNGTSLEEKELLRELHDIFASSSAIYLPPNKILDIAYNMCKVQRTLHEHATERFMIMDVLSTMIEKQDVVMFNDEYYEYARIICAYLNDAYPTDARLKRLVSMRMKPAPSHVAAKKVKVDDEEKVVAAVANRDGRQGKAKHNKHKHDMQVHVLDDEVVSIAGNAVVTP